MTTVTPKAPIVPSNRIRFRAIGIGLFLSLTMGLLTPYNNAYLNATPLGGGHFPLAPFFCLFIITLFLSGANKYFKTPLLTGSEILMIWIMMTLVSGIAYTGLARTFFINLTTPLYQASRENHWSVTLVPLLPPSLFPHGREAIEALYNGIPGGRRMDMLTLIRAIPWRVWIVPLISWGGIILVCYLVMICLVNMFSRQWLHHERLNLPLLKVPRLLEEAYDRGRWGDFLRDPFLLTGLAVPVLLHTINGLGSYIPSVPQFPTLLLAGQYFPDQGLFAGFTKLKIFIYPAYIGFAFLTTRRISFSFWIFFLLGGLFYGMMHLLGFNIPASALGVTFGPTLTHPEETQMIGAYGVFFLFIVWIARKHLMNVLQSAFRLGPAPPSQTEWFSTRLSFWGAIIGYGLIVAWCAAYGMALPVAAMVVGTFFILMLVASRIICQGGIAYFTLTAAPLDGMLIFFGPQMFTHVGILLAGVMQKVLFVDLRESLMPSLVHAHAVNQQMTGRKTILTGILLAVCLGLFVSFMAMLILCYRYGIRGLHLDWASRTTMTVYQNIHQLIAFPVEHKGWVLGFSAAGAVVMMILVVCYQRFYCWPLHPIGYLTAYSSAMRILWFSFFLGWLCNTLCLRYGGITLFKRLQLFFVGLIIGDFVMGGIWALVGYFGDQCYQVLPN